MTAWGYSERLWQMEIRAIYHRRTHIVLGPKDHPAPPLSSKLSTEIFLKSKQISSSTVVLLLMSYSSEMEWRCPGPYGPLVGGVGRAGERLCTQLKCNAVAPRVQLFTCNVCNVEVQRQRNSVCSHAGWTDGCALWWEGNVVILHSIRNSPNLRSGSLAHSEAARCNTDEEGRLHFREEKRLHAWFHINFSFLGGRKPHVISPGEGYICIKHWVGPWQPDVFLVTKQPF